MRERRWLLLTLHGILLTLATTGALKATRPKFKIATSSTTTTTTALPSTSQEPNAKENEDSVETTTVNDVNATTGHTLTGIPQIDYIWDPNLPRELNGYNLSDYPFYNSIPEEIDFKCDGLHDGFYASVPHKCQVYHHCLYGTRYDFLCANFTAFDQKTFICHFVSEVDCANSKKYWHRNDALYKATTSSTSTTTTTPRPSTTSTTTTSAPPVHDGPRDRDGPRRRRPYLQRWRPAFDYYDEDYYDDEFERGRLYGYDRGLYDDYDNRKYRRDRDRDRDLFERNLRDRTDRPPRAERDRDRDAMPRDRYPMRNGARRDPMRLGRDPIDEDRPRVRGQDQGLRYRDPEDPEFDDRRPIDRPRMGEERRYSDSKRYKDDYDDKEAPAVAASNGNSEGLVKPAAPLSSVYARPRTPPKIRRPVPLSEQDKYSYKSAASSSTTSSSTPSSAVDEPRRRPADVTDIDYYDEELFEEIRPRRPLRRRPNYRERDRDLYDVRDLERPYRPRYRDDDLRPRKYPERSRDRYYDRERSYDRGRDRLLDGGNKDSDRDAVPERVPERVTPKPESPGYHQQIDEFDREPIRVANIPVDSHDNEEPVSDNRVPSTTTTTSTTSTTTTTTTTAQPETPRPEKPAYKSTNLRVEFQPSSNSEDSQPNDEENQTTVKDLSGKYWRPTYRPAISKQQTTALPAEKERFKTEPPRTTTEDYLSEYYDEDETVPPPSSPPSRPTFRVVKRPFLPSRGGNPNPRGLLPVGMKASSLSAGRQDEGRSIVHDNTTYPVTTVNYKNINDAYVKTLEPYKEHRFYKDRSEEDKKVYNAYKVIQPDPQSKRVSEPAPSTIPTIHVSSTGNAGVQELREQPKPIPNWTIEEPLRTITPPSSPLRPNNQRTPVQNLSTQNPYSTSQYKDDDRDSNNQGYRVKQRINEVSNSHKLQDIPESEYDVTLNDALTPTLNQETSLPSGFALPIHRQPTGRDALLQPSENEYEYSKPVSQYQETKQNSFVPSTRFVPPSANRNERPKTVYYRTPETIHVAPSIQQYRHHRGSWHDYTGF